MPAPRNAIPTIKLTTGLPEDLLDRMTLHLFSEIEGRVPKGAFKEFLSSRIREFFFNRTLDLAPYTNGEPGAFTISGSPDAIARLEKLLQKGN